MRQIQGKARLSLVAVACGLVLSACGGGGGSDSGGRVQVITFPYIGQKATLGVKTVTLGGYSSSKLPLSYTSSTPEACTVSGDQLTVLKLGAECSVVAHQSGGTDDKGVKWAAADDNGQLFVITKTAQTITGPIVLPDLLEIGKSVTLTTTATSGLPVVFATDTPSVCGVSGATVTGLADGVCKISASQPGDANFLAAATSLSGAVPTGNAPPPVLTFASGYVAGGAESGNPPRVTIANTTAEGGAVIQSADWFWVGWGWGPKTHSINNGAFSSSVVVTQATIDSAVNSWEHSGKMAVGVLAPGLTALSTTGDTAGVSIGLQTKLTLNLAENAEWFGTPVNALTVDMYLGKLTPKADGSACNVKLRQVLTPTSATATTYTLNLADFQIQESCGLTLTNADVMSQIKASSIAEVEVTSKDNINGTVPDSGTTNYSSVLTLGAITFK